MWLARHLPFLIPFISAPSTCITYSRGGRQHKGLSIWNVNCAASQLRSESVCIMRWGTCSSFIASLGGPLVYQMMLSIKSFHHRNPHNPSPPRSRIFPHFTFFRREKTKKTKHTRSGAMQIIKPQSNPATETTQWSYCAWTHTTPTHTHTQLPPPTHTHSPAQHLLPSDSLVLKLLTSTEKVNLDVDILDGLAGIKVK